MPVSALTEGYRLAFAVGVGLVFVAFVVAGMVLRPAGAAEEALPGGRDSQLGRVTA